VGESQLRRKVGVRQAKLARSLDNFGLTMKYMLHGLIGLIVYKKQRITNNQRDAKYNPNTFRKRTTKQHSVVSIGLNAVTCPTHQQKFMRDDVITPFIYFTLLRCQCHAAF